MSYTLKCALTAVVLFTGFIFCYFIFGIALRPLEVVDKVTRADNLIQNYEWFKQSYQDARAYEDQIETASNDLKRFEAQVGPRKEWTFEDKTEASRLQTVVTGLKNARRSLVAEYNAKATMATRSFLKTKELPEQLQ